MWDLLSRKLGGGNRSPRKRARLNLERLENRETPATFTINSSGDGGDSNLNDNLALDAQGKTTLRAAIEQANFSAGADIIQFSNALWDAEAPTPLLIPVNSAALQDISTDISLFGPTNAAFSVFVYRGPNASGSFSMFNVSNGGTFTIERVSITSGRAPGSEGGGIRNLGTLTVSSCRIYNNEASHGGGIYTGGEDSTATISNTLIYQNEAIAGNGRGGGIYNNGSVLTLDEVSIYVNIAGARGGGLYNIGDLTATSVQIYTNEAEYGGGLSTESGTVSYSAGRIEYNTVSANGGGIYIEGGTATFSNGTLVRYNNADKGGGAYGYAGTLSFSGCDVRYNTANIEAGIRYRDPECVFNWTGGNIQGATLE